jgi:hypothetical protein
MRIGMVNGVVWLMVNGVVWLMRIGIVGRGWVVQPTPTTCTLH